MAQSRRRERDLARRRFERRRMAEMQRRAQRRRRNTIIGSSLSVAAVLVVVIVLALTLGGGGGTTAAGKNKTTVGNSTSPSTSPSPSSSTALTANVTKTCKPVQPNPPAAGEPKFRDIRKAPTKLQVIDLKRGHGAVAKSGDKVTVKYVGVGCSSGKVFDASYTDGAPKKEFTFALGKGQVIAGWDQGVAGMRVGGVRELAIPGKLAYPSGTSGIAAGAPLLFVVTLDKVAR